MAEGLGPLKMEERSYWNKIIIDEHDPLDLWLIDGKKIKLKGADRYIPP